MMMVGNLGKHVLHEKEKMIIIIMLFETSSTTTCKLTGPIILRMYFRMEYDK